MPVNDSERADAETPAPGSSSFPSLLPGSQYLTNLTYQLQMRVVSCSLTITPIELWKTSTKVCFLTSFSRPSRVVSLFFSYDSSLHFS